MRKITTAFTLFYIVATIIVTADRTNRNVERTSMESAGSEGGRYTRYPKFREALKQKFEAAVPLPFDSVPNSCIVFVGCSQTHEFAPLESLTLSTGSRAPPAD